MCRDKAPFLLFIEILLEPDVEGKDAAAAAAGEGEAQKSRAAAGGAGEQTAPEGAHPDSDAASSGSPGALQRRCRWARAHGTGFRTSPHALYRLLVAQPEMWQIPQSVAHFAPATVTVQSQAICKLF